jgi:Ca2+-binding EF-hand superfamily protein
MKSEIDSATEFAKVSLVETFLEKKVIEDRALARANNARRSALERNGTASSSTTTTIRVVPEGSAVVQAQPHSHSSSSVRPAEFAQDGTAIEEKLSEQANSAGAAAAALALKKKEESEAEVEVDLSEDFKDIFLFGRPKIFFFTVNVAIMFCCFYLAVWATNYITMISHYNDSPALWQILLIFPMVIAFQLLAAINKSVALISAVCTLNLNLTLQVANETLEMDQAMSEMKDHTLLRIVEIFNEIDTLDKKLEVVDALFDSIDKDGSGEIDQFEFRGLLRNLSLHYSDERYRKLYRAIDSDGGGTIGKSEYFSLLFPYDEYTELRNEDNHSKEMKEKLMKDKADAEKQSISSGLLAGARRVSSVGLNAFGRINVHNPNVAHPTPVAGTPAALLRQRSMQVSFKDEVEEEPSRRASTGTLSYSLKSAPIKGENKASRLTLPEDGEEDDSLNEDEGDEDGLVPRVAVKKNAGETPVPL